MIVGALIIFFLIVEPHGLARLWQIAKQKLRVWPFPIERMPTQFRRRSGIFRMREALAEGGRTRRMPVPVGAGVKEGETICA